MEYPGERAQPGGRSTHWIPSNSTRRRGRCSKSLIPRGKMGRPEEICDGRAVSCFRRSELREWGGFVCRRRLLRNLNRRVTKCRLRNTVPSLDGKRPNLGFVRERATNGQPCSQGGLTRLSVRAQLLPF